ncbi:RNA polymerase sigma factor [Bengtsoniella intestinalis]|uniref:RNA polymerase sigma factor n=1 Tax=Bengtsoniella intestinalis TaxID=3073143 RepID=UPI00391F44F0
MTITVPIQLSCEEIVHLHGDMVYRIAITQTRHKEDAEDIFQEVFIALMGHLHSIESETHLKHWLIRTTINRCKNHHLCFWKQRVTLLPEQTDSPLPQEEHALIDEVREALAQLPSKLRSPTYLYYYEGYRVEEIATILELPSGTVKSRLHTARGRLKLKLEEARSYE